MPKKLIIVGGGIIAAMEAYHAWLQALEDRETICVTIYEKNAQAIDPTLAWATPNLTPDEIISALPTKAFLESMCPPGLRDEGECGHSTHPLMEAISRCATVDLDSYKRRTSILLELGKASVALWTATFNSADRELKEIFKRAHFRPCPVAEADGEGYQVELFVRVPNAGRIATQVCEDLLALECGACKVLSPEEVVAIDPTLTHFVQTHAIRTSAAGQLQWQADVAAIYRPGGCLDMHIFLPLFYEYLSLRMGQYRTDEGVVKNCFRLKLNKDVTSVVFMAENPHKIESLRFFGPEKAKPELKLGSSKSTHEKTYVFCPNEGIGYLRRLGFLEPPAAGIACVSLKLTIPLPAPGTELKDLDQCMVLHNRELGFSWRACIELDNLLITISGGNTFYGETIPRREDAFVMQTNLLQLNLINQVIPQYISLALGRDTRGQMLTVDDLSALETSSIAVRGVGLHAMAFDGFPTLGLLHTETGIVDNARVTAGLGPRGASLAFSAVLLSAKRDRSLDDVQRWSSSTRSGLP